MVPCDESDVASHAPLVLIVFAVYMPMMNLYLASIRLSKVACRIDNARHGNTHTLLILSWL